MEGARAACEGIGPVAVADGGVEECARTAGHDRALPPVAGDVPRAVLGRERREVCEEDVVVVMVMVP